MRISRTTRWILTIGILVVLLVGLGVNYSRQKTEQSRLNTEIIQARQNLIKYTAQKKKLEKKLSQAKSEFATVEDKFASPTEAAEIFAALLETAEDADVTITDFSSSLPEKEEKEEKKKGPTYKVFAFDLTAEGKGIDSLLNFLQKLGQNFPSSSIESVYISASEGQNRLRLRLEVYCYETEKG